ncbi:hypothetical protein, unknown function [Leishmania infantum JPCM5]|uniref:Uncharacterized protein n=2 Tax=Leishmania infantum TaxID=5671 RepID=A4IAW2_LEIIN|nr:hypothetical protein, unknown function [Leishmania infantum JPCM5]CAC9543059.1 hypothetical_protein_-_uncharacterised_function [Leishmania infantum]CAM71973.1 hypothetical protein, unknown function [Leishmania infantum JPCM5]SUZ45892.1 hypothetical_protein_-_uncharacterised_function [Leishmania infantum]|eukprot:XP_001468881.1 hypothetical protein, unknown function [Leishmania infantum JPCM5]
MNERRVVWKGPGAEANSKEAKGNALVRLGTSSTHHTDVHAEDETKTTLPSLFSASAHALSLLGAGAHGINEGAQRFAGEAARTSRPRLFLSPSPLFLSFCTLLPV